MKHHSNSPEDRLDCADARVQASAWLDGEWPSSDALIRHLRACGDCREHVEELRALSARLAPLRLDAWPAEAAPRDLWPAIAARARRPARFLRTARPVCLRAAAALVGCAGTALLLQSLEGARGAELASTRGAPPWSAALHDEHVGPAALRKSLEEHLLAALERTRDGVGEMPRGTKQ